MPKRLKSISINDNITFDWSAHAINSCFGENYKAWMKAVYRVSEEEYAWFPKLAQVENGQHVAQDKVYGCINVLSEDGMEIQESHSKGCEQRDTPLIHVFAKLSAKDPYRYVGSFRRDLSKCTRDKAVYRREKTEIDLSRWYSDTEWDIWNGKKSEDGSVKKVGKTLKNQAAAYFELGFYKVIVSGKPEEMVSKLEKLQDFNCLLWMGRSNERSKKALKELDRLERFLQNYAIGKLKYDDIKDFSLKLSIGDIVCKDFEEGEDAEKTLQERYPKASMLS